MRRTAFGAVDVAFDGVGGDLGRASFAPVNGAGRFRSFGQASGAFTRGLRGTRPHQRGVALCEAPVPRPRSCASSRPPRWRRRPPAACGP